MFKTAASSIGEEMVPYQFRHSGPSWDRLRKYRSLSAIQKRWVWKAASSVERYEKSGRVNEQLDKLSDELKGYAEQSWAQLPSVLIQHVAPLKPPGAKATAALRKRPSSSSATTGGNKRCKQ